MRKKLILGFLIFGLFLSSASVTLAYLTDEKTAVNEISPTENEVRIVEEFDPPDDIVPGSVIVKAPHLVNDSEIAVYVRMAVYFSDSDAQAQCEPLQIHSKWKLHTDGYYYYEQPLYPGEQSVSLFERVVIKDTVTEQELIPFDLLVYAESVQMEGYTSAEQAWRHFTGGAV